MKETVKLTLYIAGIKKDDKQKIENLQQAIDKIQERKIELEIVDVVKDPERAEQDCISMTPTLMSVLPEGMLKIIGDMEKIENATFSLNVIIERLDKK